MATKKTTKASAISELKKQVEDYLNTLQRLQAEFDNYRKRVDSEKAELVNFANKELILKLLDVLDSFNRAIDSGKIDMDGFKLIQKQLLSLLENEGLKPIKTEGKLNPELHEAIASEESDKEENTILKEVRKGYMLNDKPIRVAQVIIAKSSSEAQSEQGSSASPKDKF